VRKFRPCTISWLLFESVPPSSQISIFVEHLYGLVAHFVQRVDLIFCHCRQNVARGECCSELIMICRCPRFALQLRWSLGVSMVAFTEKAHLFSSILERALFALMAH
jgi:hypothetical protein